MSLVSNVAGKATRSKLISTRAKALDNMGEFASLVALTMDRKGEKEANLDSGNGSKGLSKGFGKTNNLCGKRSRGKGMISVQTTPWTSRTVIPHCRMMKAIGIGTKWCFFNVPKDANSAQKRFQTGFGTAETIFDDHPGGSCDQSKECLDLEAPPFLKKTLKEVVEHGET